MVSYRLLMTTYPQYSPPRTRTADVVATSMLIAAHLGVFLLAAFFSMFYAMAADPCSGETSCNTGNITGAFVLTDVVGLAVLLVASVSAIVMVVRNTVAFWVPLVGMGMQVLLVAASLGLLDNVVA